jgi:hypothetical protein
MDAVRRFRLLGVKGMKGIVDNFKCMMQAKLNFGKECKRWNKLKK